VDTGFAEYAPIIGWEHFLTKMLPTNALAGISASGGNAC